MSKKKKIDFKSVIVLILVFTLGIVSSSLTISYAAASLSSNNVYYDTTNSGGSSSTVSGAIDELYSLASDQDILKAEIIDIIYPVGSVYISTTDSTVTMVQNRFGGTWVRYATDTTLVGYKEGTNTANATGGSKTVKLTTSNLPNHTHTTPATTVNDWYTSLSGAHQHALNIYAESSGTSGSGGYLAWGDSRGGATYSAREAGEHGHVVGGTIPAMTTNSCTNCSSSAINVQDPYTVVYMYKRTA